MKKNFYHILILFFIFLFYNINILIAQEVRLDTIKINKTRTLNLVTVRTVPKFILQFNASYLAGAMELSGHNGGYSIYDFNHGKSYCARNGFGFNLSGKLPLSKKGYFWLDMTAYFNRFVSNLVANNTADGKASYNVYGGGLGIDYMFASYHKVKFVAGATTLFSVINGKATVADPDAFGSFIDVKIKSGFRIGYAIFTGLEYAFDKNFGLNVGIKFSHVNLLLKKTTTVTVNSETDLNDNSVNPPQVYSGWKQFAFYSGYFGFSYYFSVKELRYKLP